MRGAAACVFHAVRDAAVAQQNQAIEGEAGPSAIPHEALAAFVVVGLDAHRGLDVEAVARGGERAFLLGSEACVRIVGMRVRVAAVVQRGKETATKGDIGASFEGAGLGPLVAAIVGGALIEKAVLAEPAQAAITNTPDDAVERVHGRRREAMKADLACVIGCEYAVGDDGVEVEVQVEAAAEALDVVDGRVLAPRDVGSAPLLEGDCFDEDTAESTRDVGAECGEVAQLEREREHPLAHGDRREDAVDQVRGGVRHATSSAARADAAALATEGDEQISAAVVAMESQEAVGEDAAGEVVAERLLDIARQTARVMLPGVIEEGLEVIANEGVKNGLGGTARDVA